MTNWQPIETAPETGFFLVYEDGAVRTMFRHKGAWSSPAIAAIVGPFGDSIVGNDAKHILPNGYKLEVHDCCIEPTHWMPLPQPPQEQK